MKVHHWFSLGLGLLSISCENFQCLGLGCDPHEDPPDCLLSYTLVTIGPITETNCPVPINKEQTIRLDGRAHGNNDFYYHGTAETCRVVTAIISEPRGRIPSGEGLGSGVGTYFPRSGYSPFSLVDSNTPVPSCSDPAVSAFTGENLLAKDGFASAAALIKAANQGEKGVFLWQTFYSADDGVLECKDFAKAWYDYEVPDLGDGSRIGCMEYRSVTMTEVIPPSCLPPDTLVTIGPITETNCPVPINKEQTLRFEGGTRSGVYYPGTAEDCVAPFAHVTVPLGRITSELGDGSYVARSGYSAFGLVDSNTPVPSCADPAVSAFTGENLLAKDGFASTAALMKAASQGEEGVLLWQTLYAPANNKLGCKSFSKADYSYELPYNEATNFTGCIEYRSVTVKEFAPPM